MNTSVDVNKGITAGESIAIEAENRRKTAVDIMLGVVLIATFIATFFFTFVSKVEGEVVKNEMEKIVRDLTATIKLYTLNSDTTVIKNVVASLSPPNLSSQDRNVDEHNSEIKKKAAIIFGIIIISGIIIILTQIKYIKTDLGGIILSNIIVLGLVGLTEYLFVTNISKNYQIVDGNFVRYLMLKNLQSYGNS